jgi:predicted SAM-dependent methyltransferase
MEDTIQNRRLLVNLGCGPFTKKTRWEDFDGSWNLLASQLPLGIGWTARQLMGHEGRAFPQHVRYADITKRLPFADQSVDAIYFSHVLEHLHLDEGNYLLNECFRVLKPNGVVRILVPDTEHYIATYLANAKAGASDACFELNKNLMYRPVSARAKTSFLRRLYTAATDFHSHKFMYDRAFLARCMAEARFSEIQEVSFGRSRIAEISDVELPGRIGDGLGFGLEAIRRAI